MIYRGAFTGERGADCCGPRTVATMFTLVVPVQIPERAVRYGSQGPRHLMRDAGAVDHSVETRSPARRPYASHILRLSVERPHSEDALRYLNSGVVLWGGGLVARGRDAMTPENVLTVVEAITGVPVPILKGHTRSSFIVGPKFLAYYLLWHLLDFGSVKIGRLLCKDHTTICSGTVRAKKLLREDPVFAAWYAKAVDRLNLSNSIPRVSGIDLSAGKAVEGGRLGVRRLPDVKPPC